MKKHFAILLLMCAAIVSAQPSGNKAQASDPKAKTAVDKAAAKLQSGAFQTEIKIVFTTQKGEKESQNGTLKLSGNKFYLKTDEFENFFDGKTQWVYMESVGEVTISEPTKEELQAISPMFIIKNFDKKHYVTFEMNAPKDNFSHINLFPLDKKSGDYFKIMLVINQTTNEVKKIEILQKNGEKFAVTFGNYTSIKPDNQTFTFIQKNYPKVIVNDMR